MNIASKYNPAETEDKWYSYWMEKKYFHSEPDDREPYTIVIPPPNVTGVLHMGHMMNNTLQDVLIRRARMQGKNACWVPGTDHASIATENKVVTKLREEGISKEDISRDEFMKHAWEWKEKHGGIILEQLKKLGASCDWDRTRFTMDEALYESVIETFIDLYEKGLIYRGIRMVNWDPQAKTAVSDEEVIYKEVKSKLYYLKYQVEDEDDYITIATTRPETILGDTAVCVHPEDERFTRFHGKKVLVPLLNRPVPIIQDEYVDREFGTGALKITPAHDENDYELGMKHRLESINIFNDDGTLSDAAQLYVGKDRFAVRDEIVKDLEKAGNLVKIEDYTNKVGFSERTDAVIEPKLSTQWFLKMADLAKPALEAVETGRIKFHPAKFKNIYRHWMENVRDWNISRQLWWGQRIPVYYLPDGELVVARSQEEALKKAKEKFNRPELQLSDLKQDEDVVDTWFSSWLWPISVFDGIRYPDNKDINYYYPTNDLVTAPDIIFFWVARMIMMTLKFTDQVPLKKVYVHGLVRDNDGQKMSKSKGNVLDPLDMIDGITLDALVDKRTKGLMQPQKEKQIAKRTHKDFPDGINPYGTDALRFTFLSLASTGRDIKWDMGRIEGYRNFCNKIWNAARYVMMNTEGEDCGVSGEVELSLADRWIISALQRAEQEVSEALDSFRFDVASHAAYEFIWNEYCDWYLELSKPVLWGDDYSAAQKRGTRRTLVTVLEAILRLAHPFMPFITEEIWQKIGPMAGKSGDTIMLQAFPASDTGKIDEEAETGAEWVKAVITAVRNIRGEMGIPMGKALPLFLHNGKDSDKALLDANRTFLSKLAKLESITWLNAEDSAPASATALVGDMEILVPMAGLIDKDAEIERLSKEIEKLRKEVGRAEVKLKNPKFVDKAPQAVVDKEKAKLDDYRSQQAKLEEQLEKIKYL